MLNTNMRQKEWKSRIDRRVNCDGNPQKKGRALRPFQRWIFPDAAYWITKFSTAREPEAMVREPFRVV